MTDKNKNEEEKNPNYNTPLSGPKDYELTDDMVTELFKALDFWDRFNTNKNNFTIIRIAKALSNPKKTPTLKSSNSSINSEQVRNGILAFKQSIKNAVENNKDREAHGTLLNLQLTFESVLESLIKS